MQYAAPLKRNPEAGLQAASRIKSATGVWNDQPAWGTTLANLAKHIANSYQQEAGLELTLLAIYTCRSSKEFRSYLAAHFFLP